MLSANDAARQAEVLTRSLALEPDVQRALAAVVLVLKQSLPLERACLAQVSAGRATIIASWASVPNEMVRGVSFEIAGSPLAAAVERKSGFIYESPPVRRLALGGKATQEPPFKSSLAAPLLNGSNVAGLVSVSSVRQKAYRDRDLPYFEHICAALSGAFSRFMPAASVETTGEKPLRDQMERFILISTLAHELRTPLTAIIASGGLLLEELANASDPCRKLAENIAAAADRMHARLTELLEAARSEKAGFDIRRQMADLRPLLQNIVAQMTPVAARQNQTMELEIQDDVPLVLADRDRIEQVVANLVGNAMKFTPRNGKIRVALRKRPNVVVVEVSDTGPGIAPQDQPNLFQPYYRIESDRERVPGLGLGLALCKRIIELHGGNIWVESQPGAGSTFVFSLPTDTGPPSAV